MQIAFRPAKIDLVIHEPAQPVADRRDFAREHGGVGNDDHVRGEERLVLPHELVEVQAADFLFTLEKHFDVERQTAGLLHVRFDSLEVHEDLPFVVGRAARVDLVLAHGRFERRRFPEVDRIDGLHVVVAVEEDRRRAWRIQPFAVDDRVARRFEQPHVLEADALHVIGAPLGRAPHVGLMLGKRADARNGEVLLQLVDVAIALHVDVINDLVDVVHVPHGGYSRFGCLDGQIDAIAPLFPRSDVIAHARVADQPQRKIRMRCAVAALAIGDDFCVRRDTRAFVHLLQLRGGLERAIGAQVVRPFEMDGARNGAASRGPHRGAAVFSVAARVEDDRSRRAEAIANVAPVGENLVVTRARPLGRHRLDRFLRDRQPSRDPGLIAAIEHARIRMAEELEKPERRAPPECPTCRRRRRRRRRSTRRATPADAR